MNQPRNSATFSLGSDSSSAYTEDELKSEANTTGTVVHHRSQLQPNIGGVYRENAQIFSGISRPPLERDMATPHLDEDHGSTMAAYSSHTAQYRFETREEAEERRRRNAAAARSEPHDPLKETMLEEPATYMQRVLAEHDAASASDFTALYRCSNHSRVIAQDAGVISPSPPIPAQSHLRPVSTGSAPTQHVRNSLLSTASLTSTDAGELAQEYILGTASLRDRLRESMQRESIQDGVEPSTPQPRATSLSLSPSSLQLDQSSSPGSKREVKRDAALQALDGAATTEKDEIQPFGSGQWLGAARQTSATARHQGRPDWQKGTLFSSSGRQYGLGDHTKGYVAGECITVVGKVTDPEQGTQKRGSVKRLLCFGS
jgi:hypothetical protein